MEIVKRIEKTARRHPQCAIRLLLNLELSSSNAGLAEQHNYALLARFFIQERLGTGHLLLDEMVSGQFLAEANNLPLSAGKIMTALGRIYYALGKYRDAADYWMRTIDLCHFTKDHESLVESKIGLGQIYDAIGDSDSAQRFHEDAGAILRHLDFPYLNAKQAINLAVNYVAAGKISQAKGLFIYAIDEAKRANVDEYRAEAIWYLAKLDIGEGNLSQAKISVESALLIAQKCGYKWLYGAAKDTLAKIHIQLDEIDIAIQIYLDAIESAEELQSLSQKLCFYNELSRLYETKGEPSLALYFARQYEQSALELNNSVAKDKFQDLLEYDISRQTPTELLLQLETNSELESSTLAEALRIISNDAIKILKIEYICIWMHDSDNNQLICHTISGPQHIPFSEGSVLNFDHFAAYFHSLMHCQRAIVVQDIRLHPAAIELIDLSKKCQLHSLLEMPIRQNNELVGVVSFGQCQKQRNWTKDDLLYASHLCNIVSRAVNINKYLHQQEILEKLVAERTQEAIEKTKHLEQAYGDLIYKDKALRDSASHNQTILDNLVDGIITIDALGTIRSFSLAAMNIFGYMLHEIIGNNIRVLMPEPDSSRHDSYLHNYHSTGQAKIIGIGREVNGKRKNGEIFPMELSITKSSDCDEVIFVGIVRDVTERRRLDRLKSEFISTVSHELRTPLTSIHGSLGLLEKGIGGQLAPAGLKLVEVAHRNSQRLILLINDLLDIEKLASGKMSLNITNVDIVNLVKQSIRDNGDYALKFNVQYVLGTHPPKVSSMADGGRVTQVLANLLSNAAKFSGDSPQVDITIIKDDVEVCVEVADHGNGIPVDFQSEIFNSFAQANNGDTRIQGGTGLGLKISKSFMEAMGGKIGFRTEVGKGSVFWFSLPIPLEY